MALGLAEAKRGVGVYLTQLGRAVAVKLFTDLQERVNRKGNRGELHIEGGQIILVPSDNPDVKRTTEKFENDSPAPHRTITRDEDYLKPSNSNVPSDLHEIDNRPSLSELITEVLEFVGKNGRPWRDLLEFLVKKLGLRNPDPLLRHMLERGMLVRVKRGDEEWVLRG